MSSRDELAGLVHGHDRTQSPYPLADAILAAGYSKPEAVTEWGTAHAANGVLYNIHHSRESAQAFVDSMAEVDHAMVVVTRKHVPATYGEWEPAP